MMKISDSCQTLILATSFFLALLVPLQAQDRPQDFVTAHNQARAAVGVGPLRWDNRVAAYARDYANQRKGDCQLIHSSGQYGENIAWSSGYSMTGVEAVRMWVNENVFYDYDSNTCQWDEVCGHYTQVVWRKSVKVGCAKVTCDNGETFITCNYDPPGNYVGEWPY